MPEKSPRREPSRADNADPYMSAYLASLDLEKLNLSHLEELPAAATERRWLAIACGALLVCLGLLVWLPMTSFYLLSPLSGPVYLALMALSVALGAGTLPALFRLRHALTLPNQPAVPSMQLPSWLRLPTLSAQAKLSLMFFAAAGLIALVVLVLPREVEWTGRGYGDHWFLAVGAALTAGILVGRVIVASAEARPLKEPSEPFVWPSWMRWVTLAVLIGLAITVLTLGYVWGSEPGEEQFLLPGLALFVGVAGAIWLVRRFEDMEEKYRQEARQKAILRGD